VTQFLQTQRRGTSWENAL